MRRRLVSAAAGLLAVLALAGCAGVRAGERGPAAAGSPPGDRQVRLVVSRDFGDKVLTDVTVPVTDDLTVMRLLATHADVETAYGGGFVRAIDGLASTYGSVTGDDPCDWFYWVDGIMADCGAADYRLHGAETVWWDYHAWTAAMYLPAAIAAFPAPWTDAGRPLTAGPGLDAAAVRQWAAANGIVVSSERPLADGPAAGGLVVATAAQIAQTAWLRERVSGAAGGVALVDTTGGALRLRALDGAEGPAAESVVLALPDPDDPARPQLLLAVGDWTDLAALLPRLTPTATGTRLGLAVVDGRMIRLPWEAP